MTTSAGFEMENLILGWYVLVQTGSPFLLAVVAALQYGGTLLAPGLGVVADRVSRRTLLLSIRAAYAVVAGTAAGLGIAGWLEPWHAFVIAGLGGFLRPLDMMIRFSLVADTIPPRLLMNASGFQRLTMDAPRIVGALAGAGIMAAFGVGYAYGAVAGLYLLATLIGFGISPPPLSRPDLPAGTAAARFAGEFGRGLAYIRSSGVIRFMLFLAVLANLVAYPSVMGLLPRLREICTGRTRTVSRSSSRPLPPARSLPRRSSRWCGSALRCRCRGSVSSGGWLCSRPSRSPAPMPPGWSSCSCSGSRRASR